MTSQQLFAMMLLAMTDDNAWRVSVENEIDAMPETLDFCGPGEIGYMDGSDGAECDPLQYGFTTVVECEAYVIKWREGREAAHIEDTLDLEDDILEREFIRFGGR